MPPRVKRKYDLSKRPEAAARTREAILSAALRLFCDRGYAATPMTAIAEQAGVALDTVYASAGRRARQSDQPDRGGLDALLRPRPAVSDVSPPGALNAYLVRWIRKKYRRLQGAHNANRKLREIATRYPRLFAHWPWIASAWM